MSLFNLARVIYKSNYKKIYNNKGTFIQFSDIYLSMLKRKVIQCRSFVALATY